MGSSPSACEQTKKKGLGDREFMPQQHKEKKPLL